MKILWSLVIVIALVSSFSTLAVADPLCESQQALDLADQLVEEYDTIVSGANDITTDHRSIQRLLRQARLKLNRRNIDIDDIHSILSDAQHELSALQKLVDTLSFNTATIVGGLEELHNHLVCIRYNALEPETRSNKPWRIKFNQWIPALESVLVIEGTFEAFLYELSDAYANLDLQIVEAKNKLLALQINDAKTALDNTLTQILALYNRLFQSLKELRKMRSVTKTIAVGLARLLNSSIPLATPAVVSLPHHSFSSNGVRMVVINNKLYLIPLVR